MRLVSHYEACLELYGDTHKGVDWPNSEDADKRYQVMLDVIRNEGHQPCLLLDFGCGASHLYDYMRRKHIDGITYSGLDLSAKFVELSRVKFPEVDYFCLDLLDDAAQVPTFDYIVMNGVFTEKRELPFEDMFSYFSSLLPRVFDHARVGLAFNVMSAQVDWERSDLFHVPFDVMAAFLRKHVSSHFSFRSDYGLYEYTTYVYREATGAV